MARRKRTEAKKSDFFGLAELEMTVNQDFIDETLDVRAKYPGNVCGIDPDRNGAIVITNTKGAILFKTGHFASGWEAARNALFEHGVHVILVESAFVGKFPQAGLSGARMIGAALGTMLIGTRGATVLHVTPQTWQNMLFDLGKATSDQRKEAARTYARRFFGDAWFEALPRLVAQGTCDAWGITEWWRKLPDFYEG